MFRKKLFWLADTLKGGNVKRHYNDLTCFNAKKLDKEALEQLRFERLGDILTFARITTKFYFEKAANEKLPGFPVINKSTIRSKYHQFISSDFKHVKMRESVTSGSTGSPLKVMHDNNKINRNTADAIYFGMKANFQIGQPLVYVKIWNEINQKNKFVQKAQNVVPVNVFNLSPKSLNEITMQLNKVKTPLAILGYPSAIEKMASYVLENQIEKRFSVQSVITMSEAINPGGRELISKAFNCKTYSRYSNVENGIIAQECDDIKVGYLINSSSYYVEILKLDSDFTAEDGEVGRIVVTDLYNYGMPLIRYDTGDIGAKEIVETENGAKEVLTRVEGRRMDAIFNNQGELVSSFIITNEMWKYPELLQYQFIQKGTNLYEFRLNTDSTFNRESELIKHFRAFLGKNAEITITYVDEIPLLNSGKRKKVVNEMLLEQTPV